MPRIKSNLFLRIAIAVFQLTLLAGQFALTTQPLFAQKSQSPIRPQLVVQSGHTEQLNDVVLSPNGKFVASSGFDQQVRVWDTINGDLWWTFTGAEFLSGNREIGGWPNFEFTDDSRAIKITYNFNNISEREFSEVVAIYDLQTGQRLPDSLNGNGRCSATEKLIAASPDGSAVLCSQTQKVMPKPTAPPRPRKNKNLPPPPPPILEGPTYVTRFYLRNKTLPSPVLLESNFAPEVSSIRFSPDGQMLFIQTEISNEDGTVKVWDLTTGQLLRKLEQHSFTAFLENGQTILMYRYPVNHCNCSAEQIASLTEAQKHGAVEFWDARLQTLKQSLPNQSINTISPDGKTLLLWGKSVKDEPTALEFWDVQPRAVKGKRRHEEYSFTFSPDSQTVVAIREKDNIIALCDGRTGETRHELPINQPRFAKMRFSTDNSTLTIAEDNGIVSLWDIRTGQLKTKLDASPLHQSDRPNFASYSFSADGRLVAARLSETIVIWHLDTGRLLRTTTGGYRYPAAYFSSDARSILQASLHHDATKKPKALQWDLATMEMKVVKDKSSNDESESKDKSSDDEPESKEAILRISPDGRIKALLKDEPTTVRLRDAESGKELLTLAGHTKPVGQAHFSPDGKTIATVSGFPELTSADKVMMGTFASILEKDEEKQKKTETPEAFGDKTVKLWDVQTGKLNFTFEAKGEIHYARFSSDGAKLTVASVWGGDGMINALPNIVQVWDTRNGQLLKTLHRQGPRRGLAVISLSTDGSLTLNSGDNDTEQILDTMTGEIRWSFKRNKQDLDGPQFSPDGKILQIETNKTELRDAQTGKVLVTLPCCLGRLSFSPDSQLLIDVDMEEVRFYDVATGKVKWSLHKGRISQHENLFSPNARWVAGKSAEGGTTIYEITSGRALVSLVPLFSSTPGNSQVEWIAFTPEGYYSASLGAEKFIRWRVGDKLLPAAAYAKEFNRPDLVQKALLIK